MALQSDESEVWWQVLAGKALGHGDCVSALHPPRAAWPASLHLPRAPTPSEAGDPAHRERNVAVELPAQQLRGSTVFSFLLRPALTLRRVLLQADYKWWECMLMLRRCLVALITVAVDEPMLQAAATIAVLTAMLAAHSYSRPYILASVDALDFACLCGSILYVSLLSLPEPISSSLLRPLFECGPTTQPQSMPVFPAMIQS
eukprot:2647040-Rhodomonas_salina.3